MDPQGLQVLGAAVLAFATTNVDDLILLSAFFADPRGRVWSIVAGQFLGIGGLVCVSAAAGLAAMTVPEGYPSLLGAIPLVLGLRDLLRRRSERVGSEALGDEGQEEFEIKAVAAPLGMGAVAGVTAANGGDNLSVYVPLFASTPSTIPIYVMTFMGMTALWCIMAYLLVQHPFVAHRMRAIGSWGLPYVLIGLGLWILAGAWRLVLR